jgi:hypothetical protein
MAKRSKGRNWNKLYRDHLVDEDAGLVRFLMVGSVSISASAHMVIAEFGHQHTTASWKGVDIPAELRDVPVARLASIAHYRMVHGLAQMTESEESAFIASHPRLRIVRPMSRAAQANVAIAKARAVVPFSASKAS